VARRLEERSHVVEDRVSDDSAVDGVDLEEDSLDYRLCASATVSPRQRRATANSAAPTRGAGVNHVLGRGILGCVHDQDGLEAAMI
jgi:hypothetical protein